MALPLANCCFLHCPKTGGSSVRLALRKAGATVNEAIETGDSSMPFEHRAHMRLKDAKRYWDGPFFTFVRHPVDWYASYWAHRNYTNWTLPQHPCEEKAWEESKGGTFQDWLGSIGRFFPGFCGWYFSQYLDPDTWWGRTENLEMDLEAALGFFEEDLEVEVPHSNKGRGLPELTVKQIDRIELLEHETLNKFNYPSLSVVGVA